MKRKQQFDIIIERQWPSGVPKEPLLFVADLDTAERKLQRLPRSEVTKVHVWTLDAAGNQGEELLFIDFRKPEWEGWRRYSDKG